MRTVRRTGVMLSVVAALALYGVQLLAGLVVALGVIVVGVVAGLCVAKWLERDWYGRQLEAGARAGAIACGVAGLSSLLYLLGQGPRTTADLATRSHLLGVSLAPVALALSPLGWVGADVACVVVATLLGVGLAALSAQIFGWGKDKRAVRIVAQARLAAQAQQHGELGAQVTPSGGRPASPSVRLYGKTGGPSASLTGAPSVRRTAGPALPAHVEEAPLTFDSWGDGVDADQPATLHTLQAPAARQQKQQKQPKPRRPSNARSADDAISSEERAALQAWEAALADESQPGAATARDPKASTFLNQPSPAAKRNRKKQNTRDWLC